MADNDPSLAAPAGTQLQAADRTPVARHPVRKFEHALVGLLKFWPFWVIALVLVVVVACLERAGKGLITNVIPYFGRKAQEYAVRGALPPAGAPTTTTVVVAPQTVESDLPPA